MATTERYYLTWGDAPEHEVSKQAFVRAERAAGFNNTMGQPGEPATAGFSNGPSRGRVEYAPGRAAMFTWDWKAQPPMEDIAAEVARLSEAGRKVFMRKFDTESDQYAWIVSDYEVDDAEAERIDEAGTTTLEELAAGE